jgi:hypothetical protein
VSALLEVDLPVQRRAALLSLLGAAAAEPLFSQPEKAVAVAAESVAEGRAKFFGAAFADFAKLGDILIPAYDGRPGAREARAAEFLDFLLSESPASLQRQYRAGLASFRATGEAGLAKEIGKATPYGKFLTVAKVAFYRATLNSREYAEAMSSRSRAATGVGNYWLPLGSV